MLTRREWIRQVAGATAVAAMPSLLSSSALAGTPSDGNRATMRNCFDKAKNR